MAYDYNSYQKEYRKENLVTVSVQLSRKNDKDLIDALEGSNKSGKIKELMRKGLEK